MTETNAPGAPVSSTTTAVAGDAAEPDPATEARLNAVRDEVARMWPAAVQRWSQFTLLRPPRDERLDFIARIDLKTREVAYDAMQIAERGLNKSILAILAHEVGHHVRFPGEISIWIRLLLLERDLIGPGVPSVLNLFTDLCINSHLGASPPSLARELAAVYGSHRDDFEWEQWPAFALALVVYERLWRHEPGALLARDGLFRAQFSRADEDADRLIAALFPPTSADVSGSVFDRFLFFLHVVRPYLKPIGSDSFSPPPGLACLAEDAAEEDWGRALQPSADEERALRRAADEGWIDDDSAERAVDEDAPFRRSRGLASEPEEANVVSGPLAVWYRAAARQVRMRLPTDVRPTAHAIPTSTLEWEPGDDVRDIDWRASFREKGPAIGAALPRVRLNESDPASSGEPISSPRLELFVDVSGSMPDPCRGKNHLTLAALVLGGEAIRAGGEVRACLYSSTPVAMPSFVRSERDLSRFLLRYLGSGTTFPHELLRDWVRGRRANGGVRTGRSTTRVILSDSDFVDELEEASSSAPQDDAPDSLPSVLRLAAASSAPLVVVLSGCSPEEIDFVKSRTGANVVSVDSLEAFPVAAARISRALFSQR